MSRFKLFFLSFTLLFAASIKAQIKKPVKWTYVVERQCDEEAVLVLKASIEKGWHLYSQKEVEDGPIPTTFSFQKNSNFTLNGKTAEGKSITKIEPAFDNKELSYFEDKAEFRQKIKINTKTAFKISGSLEFMVCNEEMCLPPENIDFTFSIDNAPGKTCAGSGAILESNQPCDCDTAAILALSKNETINSNSDTSHTGAQLKDNTSSNEKYLAEQEQEGSCNPFETFWMGFIAGFFALITPCVYSMIPLTVSFFTKQSKTKAKGIKNALIYGFFIILIYDALTMLITVIFGPDALNEMASNIWMNIFFFAIFMVFAFSFLGAFEITLPASWINKADSASDKGGMIGIFFMAFTLVLVSFSCTGPVVGSLLPMISKGTYLCPLMGMTGFGLCLALPFALFAMFPGWLNSMPKSGGWLNSVKVVLGLLEVALAMKFLSNADMVAGWHLISREVFIAIWIATFGVMGIYLLGFVKFSHDSDLPFLSVTRSLLALTVLSFTIYLIPGLWGAPLNLIGGFPPPQTREWSENFDAFTTSAPAAGGVHNSDSQAGHSDGCPKGINNCFHDYNEGVAFAKKVGKPVLLDFTGWTCVNCRKMEQNVWPQPSVLPYINNDFVLISLYVDDRTELPADSQYVSKHTDKKIKTTGNKWSEMQTVRYNTNTQPYYVLLDNNENILNKPRGYTPDVTEYSAFLKEGLEEFKKRK